jgi:hypothetical protein
MLRFMAPSMMAAAGSWWQARNPVRQIHLKIIGGALAGGFFINEVFLYAC